MSDLDWDCMNVTTRLGVSLRPRLSDNAVNNKCFLYMLFATNFTDGMILSPALEAMVLTK